MNDNMSEDRLTKIETILADQARQIEDLSEMTAQQWTEIERLKRQLEFAKQKIEDIGAGKNDKSEEGLTGIEIAALNKPPHY
ncbi:MAG: SlyX family protein [Pseudobdellovibrionaceae bacterium]